MYALKDNKCREDITDRTPEIATLTELGYNTATSLTHIVQNMNSNGILVYSVSNVTSTNIYPVKIPADDSAVVVINKVNSVATISFHFYDSFYTNHYSHRNLAGWVKADKIELPQVKLQNIPSGYSFNTTIDLTEYGITNDAHVNVTLLTTNSFVGDKPKIDHIFYVKRGKLYLHVKNNSSSTLASVEFNVCIL